MDKLKQLLALCKCGVSIEINPHRDVYQTAAARLAELSGYREDPEIAPEVRAEMIRTDTIISLHFYPDTPVGFFEVWHHDLDLALDEALECLSYKTGFAAGSK